MPTTKIFDDITNPGIINKSDFFTKTSFMYIVTPDITSEVEIDCFINIFPAVGVNRMIPLQTVSINNASSLETPTGTVSTENILQLPEKYLNSEFNMQLGLLASTQIRIEVYNVVFGCCLQKDFDELKKLIQLALLEKTVTNIISNPVGSLVGIAGTLLLNELKNRAGFSILNPATNTAPMLIGYGISPSDTEYDFRLEPGQQLVEELDYDGLVYAKSLGSGDLPVIVRDYIGEVIP